MNKLFAGFWIGEFGWEIMTWIPHIRAVAKNYEHVIVGCKSGHECLYEFANEFVNFDCSSAKAEQWFNKDYDTQAVLKAYDYCTSLGCDLTHIIPQEKYSYSMKTHKEWLTGLQPQEFKKIEATQKIDIDIVLNIRNRTEHDSSFRNWELEHAEEFCSHFRDYRVACIGTQEQSLTISNGSPTKQVGFTRNWVDMRLNKEVNQEYVNNLLCNAKVFVSSINGATHLASLCGCPQVVWVTKPDHKERIEKTWNPFNTDVEVFLSPDGYWKNRTQWQPPVYDLVKAVKAFL